eukprot:CAMPEP_0167786328 /NCGR_PEP_ID=MMETSP0111_2-20121227/8724_1 /TAXON_ID=91324 /ORGANISM="Lotharella globosa, Strain CCCM811" /LENGTH=565 /DNA_ID=CAMNT_0007677683 /DNA_START=22 /DNA_END=1719 /DNA_ORIENTATION=-
MASALCPPRLATRLRRSFSTKAEKLDALIVGAGFAGMYQLHKLRSLGMKAQVVDVGQEVGGTWYWNRYPGARCDIRSMDYSYTFDPELDEEWQWSEKYASQPEILAYAKYVADKYDLRRDIRFETRLQGADFDSTTGHWVARTECGDSISAQHLIMASGSLSAPKEVDIPGVDAFEGESYWTSWWPEHPVDFKGKRVAIIGTGASGVQSIPVIAEQCEHLTVFQRTPAYVLPAFNGPLSKDYKDNLKARREQLWRSQAATPSFPLGDSALEVSKEERDAVYERGWQAGGLEGILSTYKDLLVSAEANDTAAQFVYEKIRAVVRDPEVAEALIPDSYPFGTKRPCLGHDYYEAYNRDNVKLHDLRKDPFARIVEDGILTESGAHIPLDVIVYATGFDALTGAVCRVDVRGIDGVGINDKWRDGPLNFLGLTVSGFPNFYMITGPGSPSVLANMLPAIEQHVDYITDLVKHMRDTGAQVVMPTEAAEREWTDMNTAMGNMTLFPKANSWYMGANVPGKPRMILPFMGGFKTYIDMCDEVAANGYTGLIFGSAGEEMETKFVKQDSSS